MNNRPLKPNFLMSRAVTILSSSDDGRQVRPLIRGIIKKRFNGNPRLFAHWYYKTFSHRGYVKNYLANHKLMSVWNVVDGRIATVPEALALYKVQLKLFMRDVYSMDAHGFQNSDLMKRKHHLKTLDPIGREKEIKQYLKPDDWVVMRNQSVHRVNMADVLMIKLASRHFFMNGAVMIEHLFDAYLRKHSQEIIHNYNNNKQLI